MAFVKACGIMVFRNLFRVIEEVYSFFMTSPKGTRLLNDEVDTEYGCASDGSDHRRR